jgi:TonB-linked SusC/RagA family outer membrane protein
MGKKNKTLLAMKLLLCFILISSLNVSGSVYSQKTTFDLAVSDKTVKEVFKDIESQTQFRFLYNDDFPGLNRIVSFNNNDKGIDEVLTQILAGANLTYRELDNELIVITPVELVLQQSQISGIVTDVAGNPIPGATVIVKGTTRGTTTGMDGKYAIPNVSPGEVLVYSFIGMRIQEILIENQRIIDVQLIEDFLALEEVVAVGYGYQRRESLTGAISSLPAAEIVSTKSPSVIGNIQGKIPGLQIRTITHEPGVFNTMMSIRGFGSPLIVIDGVARDGTGEFERLNPSDIESISVLKDAAAAIYGMNAANGVIIVTTKQGTAGKTSFKYNNYSGIKGPTGMAQTVDAYTYRVMRNEMEKHIGNAPQFGADVLEKYRIGTEPGFQDHNWVDLMLEDWVFQQQHNLSVSGGTDRIQNFTSFAYTEDNGILSSGIQEYRRYNFRSNTTTQLANNLKGTISVSGRYDNNTSPRNGYIWVFKPIMVNDRGYNYHVVGDPSRIALIPPENTNPWAMAHEDIDGYNKYSNMQYQTTVDMTYDAPFLKGLRMSVLGAYDGNINQNSHLRRAYYQYDYLTGAPGPKRGAPDYYQMSNNLFRRMNFQAQVAYRQTFNESHNFQAMVVHELRESTTNALMASRTYDDVYTHDIINQGSASNMQNSGNRVQTALVAYLGRLNYDYMGKYLFEAAFRYDGSYRYSTNNRWSFFPSVSAGWRLSEESFIRNNLTFVDNLRIRASYGMSGIDAGNPHQHIPGYTFGAITGGYVFNPGDISLGMLPPGIVNDYLSWVQTTTSNIGLDWELWKGGFGGAFEVFERRRDGLLATKIQSVPNTFGSTFPQENLNSDLVHGVELALSHRNRINNFSYRINANATYSREKRLHVETAPFASSWQEWKSANASNRYNRPHVVL